MRANTFSWFDAQHALMPAATRSIMSPYAIVVSAITRPALRRRRSNTTTRQFAMRLLEMLGQLERKKRPAT
jgi:hypothetical protein